MTTHKVEIDRLCREYDNPASVTRTASGPRWNEQPAKCHIAAELMSDEEAATFIRSAYAVSHGCRDEVMHGDLRTSPEGEHEHEWVQQIGPGVTGRHVCSICRVPYSPGQPDGEASA